MFRRMTAIILGVMALAMLNALVFPEKVSVNPVIVSSPVALAADLNPAAGAARSKSESISPFALARSINEIRRRKVDVSLAETWQKFGIEAADWESCSNDCRAELYQHQLTPDAGAEVVLKLTRFVELCRYLVFARSADGRGWKFLGHVDHNFNKYEMARHRVALVNGKPFLVIRGQEGSGSGYALYAETWYDVSNKGVKAVLSYPSDGHTYPWPAGLSRSFTATNVPDRKGADRLTIQYTVDYDTSGSEDVAVRLSFANRHRAVYRWDRAAGIFVLDPQSSNISEREINAIANIESEDEPKDGAKIGETTFYSSAKAFVGGGYEVFLKHNLPRLMTIAKGPNTKSKQWLQRFLKECEETDEKKALVAALK